MSTQLLTKLSTAELLKTVSNPGGLGIAFQTGMHLLNPPALMAPVYQLPTLSRWESSREVACEPSVFGTQVRLDLLHRVSRWERNNWRQGTAMAKKRGETRHSTRKVRPQKGTGSARAGDSRMPHWVGGGVAHPPRPRDFTHDLPRQVRQQGLRVALSARFADQKLLVLEDLLLESPKTALLHELLVESGLPMLDPLGDAASGAAAAPNRPSRLLFVGDEQEIEEAENFRRAADNLKYVNVITRNQLHAFSLLYHDRVLLTERVVKQLNVLYKRIN